MKIKVRNGLSLVLADEDELAALDDATSYPIEGAQFTAAFKAKVWDGKEHLLRKAKKQDGHLIPTGVLAGLDEIDDADLIDERRHPGGRYKLEWIGKSLRDYQLKAIESVIKDRGLFTGRGLLNLPIRSGKTMIAGGLIQATGLRTLFVVSSTGLLGQTERSFQACLADAMGNCPVGVFGDGRHTIDHITIATAQSLLARKEQAAKLMAESDLLIVDEAHHLEGEAWRALILKSDAMFKIGLSATVYVSREKQNNKSSIWLRACTGPVLSRVSMQRLIDAGYLKRPTILFYRCEHPHDIRQKDWQWVAREQLANNNKRNHLLARLAQKAVNIGKRVLVDTGRKDQMATLHKRITDLGVSAEMIWGKTSTKKRDELIARLQSGELQCLVGTVLGEGIDIPELEVVINAEGQKSATAAIQRMRNMTEVGGKGDIYFIDIADVGAVILQRHALDRLKLYKGLRGFRVKSCVIDDPKHDPLMSHEESG